MKTYKEMKEQQELNELSILRTGSALVFGSKAKTAGNKLLQHLRNAKSDFTKAKRQEETDKKIDALLDGLVELTQAQYQERIMLGNMTSISVSQSLFNQRTNKQILKLMKRK